MSWFRTLFGCGLLIAALAAASPASAASLVRLQLQPAGFPGATADRLTLTVLLLPGEEVVAIQMRPVRVFGDELEEFEPVERRSGGDHLSSFILARAPSSNSSRAALVVERFEIPHDDLLLPDGECRIGYEVRGYGARGVEFVQATPLIALTATDRGIVFAGTAEQSAPPAASLDELAPIAKRFIHFATNRKLLDAQGDAAERFGDVGREDLALGSSVVNIPVAAHETGDLEVPLVNWWRRKPEKYFCVDSLVEFPPAVFDAALGEKDLLVFVHGYNYTFDEALLRAAQLRHDMAFTGEAILFSWPSAGDVLGYRRDEEQAAQSAAALKGLLERLLALKQPKSGKSRKIHIVAHSMGTRIVVEACAELAKGRAANGARLANVILAAADCDRRAFEAGMPNVQALAERVTYYYSDDDLVLRAGKTLYRTNPVGLGPWSGDSFDSVNADRANSIWVGCGHRYYAGSDRVLLDMNLLVNRDLPPDQRQPPLSTEPVENQSRHWIFRELPD